MRPSRGENGEGGVWCVCAGFPLGPRLQRKAYGVKSWAEISQPISQ